MLTKPRKKPAPRTRRVRQKPTVVLNDADRLTFEALEDGPLDSKYLYEFTKHLREDAYGQRKRLRKLFDLGELDRPLGLNNPLIWWDYAVYSRPGGRIASVHNYFNASLMANLKLNVPGYIHRHVILEGRNLKVENTEPDDLFGIDYGDGERYFAVETDLANENYEDTDTANKSTRSMLQSYHDLIQYGTAKEHFNIPNFFVIIFTPRESRTARMMKQAEEIWGEPVKNVLFKTVPMESRPFKTMPLMPEVATTPFLRAGCSPFDILNPERQ